ncbi:hypothetical protein Y032_0034g2952 [Ancylostoma ceylanicum]|uniref:Uncharacterized protein n=1 Tax=Ancylostoma ceylanicum TaxID=53326 RepID=A0A016UMD1_9BILA|nr:hypothetical protein Y032_0034g2952 [Ancylostoma ceylanicum]
MNVRKQERTKRSINLRLQISKHSALWQRKLLQRTRRILIPRFDLEWINDGMSAAAPGRIYSPANECRARK